MTAMDVTFNQSTTPRNVYEVQTLHCLQMRIGHQELAILKHLYETDEMEDHFRSIKESISGVGKLHWYRYGFDKSRALESVHKSLARATKTLEEKGLIERIGYPSDNGLSKITWLKLTKQGIIEYHKRMDRLTEESKDA